MNLAAQPQPRRVETVRQLRIRIMSDGEPVKLNLFRKFPAKHGLETAAAVPTEVDSDRLVKFIRRYHPEDKTVPHGETEKQTIPQIQPAALDAQLGSESINTVREPRIRIMSDGRPVSLDLSRNLRSKDQLEPAAADPKEVKPDGSAAFLRRRHRVDKTVSHGETKKQIVPQVQPAALDAQLGPESMNTVRKPPIRLVIKDHLIRHFSSTKPSTVSPARRKNNNGRSVQKLTNTNRNKESSDGMSRPIARKGRIRGRFRLVRKIPGDVLIRPYRIVNGTIILYEARKHGTIRLVRKSGPPLGKHSTAASETPMIDQRDDKMPLEALTSLLDEFGALNVSELSNSSLQTSHSMSHERSNPWSNPSRPSLTGSLAPKPQRLNISDRLFSTRILKAFNRNYATAAIQTLQGDALIDPPTIKTTPDGNVKGGPGQIRDALRMWQEQHEVALADVSGRPPSSTLSDTQNLFTQSGEDDSSTTVLRDDEVDEDDDVNPESDEQTPDIFAHQVFLRRGDLVELVAGQAPLLAIFVRNVADQCQFYTIRGEWVNRGSTGARWAVSGFVDPSDLNGILPYLPAEEVAEEKMDRLHPVDVNAPRDAGSKVINQMMLFHRAADTVFRNHAERINRIYDIIAPSEGFTGPERMSLKDIAMKVLMKEDPSELTQPMMWTIHRALTQSQNISWDKINYRQNPTYEIYPQQGLKYIHQVREWVREYQEGITQEQTNQSVFSNDSSLVPSILSLNPIATFVHKARSAIRRSRTTRPLSKTGFIGPSSTRINVDGNFGEPYKEIELQKFDHNEKIIIHYLDVWATSSYMNVYTNLASLGPMILRATRMYEDFELDQSKGFTLLQEIGVVTPWENKTVYRTRGLRLPGHDGGSGEVSRMLLSARTEYNHFDPKDSMEGLRKDWSDMPVFCIDSAETLERDDGVSLEPIEGDQSAYWVHVHVANPSAFIDPESSIAKYAALLAESVYFPERKYPMLSPNMTRDRLGLANDRPCITFSAKVSTDGDLLEKKVTPGIIRNVHYLTPEKVSQGLSLTETDKGSATVPILTVGGPMPSQPVKDYDQVREHLTNPEHIEMLRKLLELGEAARHKRIQGGAPDFYSSARIEGAYPIVYAAQSTDKYSMIENQYIRQFEGDPIITIQKTTEGYSLVAKMVSDLMIIAGDVGASWCSERNIPVPYRGIIQNLEPASSPEAFKRDVIDPKVAKYGHAEQDDLRRYMRLVGQAQASNRPLRHLTLGLPAYCKTTSPLRRYVDLYAHWQIEAAIRHEAATGTSLVGSTDDSYLPFSSAQVEDFAAGVLHRERTVSFAKMASTRHWMCQALFRAFYFGEATLPETFEVRCVDGYLKPGFCPGWLAGWSIKVQLVQNGAVSKEGGWNIGDVWEARMEGVDPYRLVVQMEPVRLVEKGEVV